MLLQGVVCIHLPLVGCMFRLNPRRICPWSACLLPGADQMVVGMTFAGLLSFIFALMRRCLGLSSGNWMRKLLMLPLI